MRGFKWIAALGCLYAPALPAAPPADAIPGATDLGAVAREIARDCRPLLLEVAAEYCSYCKRLEQEYLKPMRLNAADTERVVMRRLMLGDYARISDFDDRPTDSDALARRYSIKVTPTLLFLDAQGNELAERIVGFSTPELYGSYLDAAIELAGRALREAGRCATASNRP